MSACQYSDMATLLLITLLTTSCASIANSSHIIIPALMGSFIKMEPKEDSGQVKDEVLSFMIEMETVQKDADQEFGESIQQKAYSPPIVAISRDPQTKIFADTSLFRHEPRGRSNEAPPGFVWKLMDQLEPQSKDPEHLVLEPFATDPKKNEAVFAWIDQVFANNSYQSDSDGRMTFSIFPISQKGGDGPPSRPTAPRDDRVSHSFLDAEHDFLRAKSRPTKSVHTKEDPHLNKESLKIADFTKSGGKANFGVKAAADAESNPLKSTQSYQNYSKLKTRKTPYSFHYKVDHPENAGNFQHEEVSDGDETQGRFNVARPGFESRTIYSVTNDTGFNAETSYTITSV